MITCKVCQSPLKGTRCPTCGARTQAAARRDRPPRREAQKPALPAAAPEIAAERAKASETLEALEFVARRLQASIDEAKFAINRIKKLWE